MSRRSLESSCPMMAPSLVSKRTSNRYSTYSAAPSFSSTTTTLAPSGAATPTIAEINSLTESLDRLENKHLAQQRFVPSPRKTDDLSKLALGAKLERALDRRMTGQDAVMKTKKKRVEGEKVGIKS